MDIALVLSGGFAKGAYQIGALRAISEFVPIEDIKYISSASIGTLNAYAYMTGNLDRAEEMWKSVCNNENRIIINKILKSSLLQQNISVLYDSNKELSQTFYCSYLDLGKRNIVYKDLSKVDHDLIPRYLKAAIAVPLYNKAVQIGNASYYDGGFVDNIPIYPILKHKFDYIICVYFDDASFKFENSYVDNKVIKIAFPGDTVLSQSFILRQESIDEMISDGYERSMFILKSVFSNGHQDLECISKTIDYMNKNIKIKSPRISVDIVATNLNKVMQKLTKRKIL